VSRGQFLENKRTFGIARRELERDATVERVRGATAQARSQASPMAKARSMQPATCPSFGVPAVSSATRFSSKISRTASKRFRGSTWDTNSSARPAVLAENGLLR